MNQSEILLIYDRHCPACEYYCQIVRIRDSLGTLRIIDARAGGDVMQEITQLGLDIDQGMVVKMRDQFYYGADAIHVLSLMSSRSGLFNRFNYWLFRSKRLAGWLYPILRSCRNLLLKMQGKTKINNLNRPNNDHF